MKRYYKHIKKGNYLELVVMDLHPLVINSLIRNFKKDYSAVIRNTNTGVTFIFSKKYIENPNKFRKMEYILSEHLTEWDEKFYTSHSEINRFAYNNKLESIYYCKVRSEYIHFLQIGQVLHPIYKNENKLKVSSINFKFNELKDAKIKHLERAHETFSTYNELVENVKIEKSRKMRLSIR